MCRDILISLHPKHSESVLAGKKTAELRRRRLRIAPGTRVWIYTTLPRGCVNALATVEAVHEGSHAQLWKQFGAKVGISRSDFDKYMVGIKQGCVIVLSGAVALKREIKLEDVRRHVKKFHPPQFFKRLSRSSDELELFSSVAP